MPQSIFRSKFSLAWSVVFLLAFEANGQTIDREANWPQWRGPNANGTAPKAEPPLTWDAKTNIKWQTPLPGVGTATPIVWGDQIFVVAAIKTDRVAGPADRPMVDPKVEVKTKAPSNFYQFVVMSFDRATGKERWRKVAAEKVPHEGHHDTHTYASGSPTTDGKFLYVSFGSFGNYCYDLQGNIQWQRDLERLSTRFGFGEAVTPVIHGDSLLLNWDQEKGSALYCLDARTGQTKWRQEREETSTWNTPLVVEYKGQTQVVVNGKNRARGYDFKTGKNLWEFGAMTINPIPSPVAADGVIYCMSGYQGSMAVAIPFDSRGDISKKNDKVLWRFEKGTPYVPSPLLAGQRLYFTQSNDSIYTVLDIKTGKALIERERLPGMRTLYASPVAAAGRVYLIDRDGTCLVLRQADQLEVLATNRLEDTFNASPVMVGKQLILRGYKNLYCIESK
jgi:outer membrane protein assembly factor BamB